MIASCYWTHYVVTAQIHGMSEPPIGLPNKRSFTRSAFTICHLSYATTNLPNCIFPVVQLTKQVWSVPLLENSAPALWNVLCNTLYKRVVVLFCLPETGESFSVCLLFSVLPKSFNRIHQTLICLIGITNRIRVSSFGEGFNLWSSHGN